MKAVIFRISSLPAAVVFAILLNSAVQAQDIPMYTQQLTHSFLYNPAIAGNTFGSLTYSYQQAYSKVSNAPKSHFLSFHAPLVKHKFGMGVNVFQEEVNFMKNTYLAAAFAHHIRFGRNMLSMGVSGEFNMMRLNGNTNSNPEDPEYLRLANGIDDMDFSAGLVFQSTFFRVGASANRMATAWIKNENSQVLSSYFTTFAQGMIPLRGGEDILEPTITYRKFSETNNTLDVGLFYTYDNRFTAGAGWRNSDAATFVAAVRITPKFLVGYSYEMFMGDLRSQVGGTNQITLRLDFNDYNYKDRFRDDYKDAVSYRRKSLSRGSSYSGSKSPKQLHKQMKKLSAHSPNKRYTGGKPMNPRKLSRAGGLRKMKR